MRRVQLSPKVVAAVLAVIASTFLGQDFLSWIGDLVAALGGSIVST